RLHSSDTPETGHDHAGSNPMPGHKRCSPPGRCPKPARTGTAPTPAKPPYPRLLAEAGPARLMSAPLMLPWWSVQQRGVSVTFADGDSPGLKGAYASIRPHGRADGGSWPYAPWQCGYS